MLVCNKIDLYEKRVVSKNEGIKLAKDYDMIYMETSAKTNSNVHEAFTRPAIHLLDKIESGLLNPKECPGIAEIRKNDKGNAPTGRGGCCQC